MGRNFSPSLVYEWASDLELLISCQGVESPTDEEWDGYLACVARSSEGESPRALVITEGGRPSREQQLRLTAATNGRMARVAVISRAGALRFIVSIMALANPHIKSFNPAQKAAAFAHLAISPEQHERVHRIIDRLQKKLLRTPIAVNG